jgi:site-specific DNA recombinase
MKHEYLMGHCVRCGQCGRALHINSLYWKTLKGRQIYKYYICEANATHRTRCKGIRCNTDRIDCAVWEWVKSLLFDPAQLEHGLEAYREAGQIETVQIQDRLKLTDELLKDHKAQLSRLLDLYLSGQVNIEFLVDRKSRLESTIAALERERAEIAAQLEQQILTPEQMETIKRFSEQVAQDILSADENHAVRRQIIELLDVAGVLRKEEESLVLDVTCIVGSGSLGLKQNTNCDSSLCPKGLVVSVRLNIHPLSSR